MKVKHIMLISVSLLALVLGIFYLVRSAQDVRSETLKKMGIVCKPEVITIIVTPSITPTPSVTPKVSPTVSPKVLPVSPTKKVCQC